MDIREAKAELRRLYEHEDEILCGRRVLLRRLQAWWINHRIRSLQDQISAHTGECRDN